MSTYFIAAFLFLTGATQLIKTEIPVWVVGVSALAAGLSLLYEKHWAK